MFWIIRNRFQIIKGFFYYGFQILFFCTDLYLLRYLATETIFYVWFKFLIESENLLQMNLLLFVDWQINP